MSRMLACLKSTTAHQNLPPETRRAIEAISQSHRLACKAFVKYSKLKLTTMVQLSNLNKDIKNASSSGLSIGAGRSSVHVIDAAGTYGMNLRGHNPSDYKTSVLHAHDPHHDYWTDLESVFEQKTGLAHLFPAVSGTSGNDIEISLAVRGNFPKRRIVAMAMGYHGKTLISLAATYKQRIRKPFGPLYPHVSFVDPLADDIEQQLTQLFESGDVALVTLETIQGEGGVRSCPQRFFDFLSENRSRFGYFITVDEVQSAMYCAGRFLNYQGKLANPYLIIVGKGISDMVFPVAAAVVSANVFQSAYSRNEATVRQLANLYRCQFGAHTALHAIESSDQLGLAQRAKEIGDYFKERLQQISSDTGMVKEIRGEGLIIGFELAPQSLPKLLRGSFGRFARVTVCERSEESGTCGIRPRQTTFDTFFPPLTSTKSEIDLVLDTTNRCLSMDYGNSFAHWSRISSTTRVWFPQTV